MKTPTCDKCGQEMKAFGALVFSPPQTFDDNTCGHIVAKYHICNECFPKLFKWMHSHENELK